MKSDVWVPIATLLLGFLLSHVTETRREKRASDRAQSAERKSFERQALLDVLASLLRVGRIASRIHTTDYISFHRNEGRVPFGKRQEGNPDDEALLEASQELIRLEGQLLDESLRDAVRQCREAAGFLAMRQESEGAEQHYVHVMDLFNDTEEKVGTALRSTL